jgi:hypothetical protein
MGDTLVGLGPVAALIRRNEAAGEWDILIRRGRRACEAEALAGEMSRLSGNGGNGRRGAGIGDSRAQGALLGGVGTLEGLALGAGAPRLLRGVLTMLLPHDAGVTADAGLADAIDLPVCT